MPVNQRLVTQKEAARIAGVNQTSISSLKNSDKWGFFVGTKVNIIHPSWFAYLNSRGLSPFGMQNKMQLDEFETDDNDLNVEDNENIESDEYNYILEWKKWRAISMKETAKKKELERERLEGALIPLEFIEKVLADYIALLHKRFLDMPQDHIDRIMQIFDSSHENRRQLIIESMTHEIEMNLRQTKAEIVKTIEKYQDELDKK